MARYALVIGISEYKEPFEILSKAYTDADAVKKLLEQSGGYRVYALNGTVTRTQLIEELKTFLEKRVERDEALIYFTGHGFEVVDPDGVDEPQGVLATSECIVKVKDNKIINQEKGLFLRTLNNLIADSNIRSLV